MDAFSAGFDISNAKFIFSHEWLLLSGTFGNRGCVQIRANEYLNGQDGMKRFEVKTNHIVDGYVTCAELCTIERLGKMVVMIGGVRSLDNRVGFIEVVDLRIQGKKVDISPSENFGFLNDIVQNISGITCMVYKPDREMLLVATDVGEIIMIDLYQGKEVYREVVDASGIVKIQLTVADQLACLGHSSTTPVKIFDLRFSENPILQLATQLEVPANSPLKPTASFREPLSSVLARTTSSEDLSRRTDLQRTALQSPITCLTTHPTQDRILLGNATGSIILWDLRMNSTVAFQSHSSRVNYIAIHPDDSSQVISTSTDGSIKQTNTRKMPVTAPVNVFSDANNRLYTDSDVFTILQRDVAILGVDVDVASRSLLVNAEFGQIFRLSMR